MMVNPSSRHNQEIKSRIGMTNGTQIDVNTGSVCRGYPGPSG